METLKRGALPTGAVDSDGRPIRIDIAFVLPNRTRNNLALELAKIHEGKGTVVALNEAAVNQIRVCMREIDGRSVSFEQLESDGIDKLLTQKQQDTLIKAFEKLTTANEGTVRSFVGDLEYLERDGERLCRGRLPVAPGRNEGDENAPRGREVVFRLPNRQTVAKAQENARRYEQRGALVAANEANLNMIRFSVVEVDGKALDEKALRGDKVDDVFSQPEQSLIVLALEVLMTADRGEVDDFLSTVGDLETPTASVSTSRRSTNTDTEPPTAGAQALETETA